MLTTTTIRGRRPRPLQSVRLRPLRSGKRLLPGRPPRRVNPPVFVRAREPALARVREPAREPILAQAQTPAKTRAAREHVRALALVRIPTVAQEPIRGRARILNRTRAAQGLIPGPEQALVPEAPARVHIQGPGLAF